MEHSARPTVFFDLLQQEIASQMTERMLAQPDWSLPQQTPTRVYAKDLPSAGPEIALPPEVA